jgi:hypothetical protein
LASAKSGNYDLSELNKPINNTSLTNILTYLHIIQMDMVKDEVIQKDRLLTMQESLLGFIHEEVVMPTGKHYYDASKKSNRDFKFEVNNILMYKYYLF